MAEEQKKVYQLIIPLVDSKGKAFEKGHFNAWARSIAIFIGSVTVLGQGIAISQVGNKPFVQHHIVPVNILCTQKELAKVLEDASTYFDQEHIVHYMISGGVL